MLEAMVCGRSCVRSPTGAIMSFSSDQVTGTVFSSEHAFPSKFWIYLEHCPLGEAVIFRPSEPFLYEVATHVKKLPFHSGHYYYDVTSAHCEPKTRKCVYLVYFHFSLQGSQVDGPKAFDSLCFGA